MTKLSTLKPAGGVAILVLALLSTSPALAQRTGDSARITMGIVEHAERVPLKSNTTRNALIGGAVGWALTSRRSAGTQAAGALGGAAIGGGATTGPEGSAFFGRSSETFAMGTHSVKPSRQA